MVEANGHACIVEGGSGRRQLAATGRFVQTWT